MSKKIPLQFIAWIELPKEAKMLILHAFDFDVDSGGFIIKNNERVIDKYIQKTVKYDNASLMPTHSSEPIIIDDNPLSISSYLEEFDVKEVDEE